MTLTHHALDHHLVSQLNHLYMKFKLNCDYLQRKYPFRQRFFFKYYIRINK